ncbi:MAG: tetratricopeptide repeat protein [Chitinophagaceae bacterium]
MCSRILIFLSFLLLTLNASSQEAAAIDSIKKALQEANSMPEKIYLLDNLSRTYMNVDLKEAERYGQELITMAESSRDRRLMVFAYQSNGIRCSYFTGQQGYTEKAIAFFQKGLDIARENKLDSSIGGLLLRLSSIYLSIPDKEKSLGYANEAFSLISTLNNDSLRMESHNTYGVVYLARKEKIMALRHFLNALRIADELKGGKEEAEARKATWLRKCYSNLSTFYANIEAYDKAIDYATLAYNTLDKIQQRNVPYQRAIDINGLGNLFAAKKNSTLAMEYYRRSIAMADSLKFSTLKVPGYTSLLNEYLRNDQPSEALRFMRSSEGAALSKFLGDFGLSSIIDQAYAVIFTGTGQLDSATYHFERARPYFENATSFGNRINFYAQLASYYKKKGDNKNAAEYFERVRSMSESIGELEVMERAAKHLDTVYRRSGNLTEAIRYNEMYHLYKDSLTKLAKEKELAQVEATDEQLRIERLEKERQEAKRKRFNIQYLAITIGIAAVFVLMVMMGMFKVSATTIKLVGFFAFLMFFEFIFLIFKKNIATITEGEPWKDLLFMIGLAALLLPLHHWLEHKVIHYLTSHNRLTTSGQGLLQRFRRKKIEGQ